MNNVKTIKNLVTVINQCLVIILLSMVAPVYSYAQDDVEAEEGILDGKIPQVKGPRRTVAVGKFDSIGSFAANYGDWSIGGGLSSMFVTALREADRFIVVERANLQQVLAEQELAAGGLTRQEGRPQSGNLQNAQIIIYGAVTEFDAGNKGGGLSLGVSSGALGSLLGGGASLQGKSGTVGLDIRLVDTSSGEIIDSFSVKETAKSRSFDVNAGYKGMNLGTNQFYKTPLGQAARKAITKAVQNIARKSEYVKWSSSVVEFDGSEIYLNYGENAGLKSGDKFVVERIVRRLTDPTTGELLSVRKKELGIITLTGVEERLSYGDYAAIDTTPPERGDMAVKMSN
ncbi:MAG: CsgG/HfaB family protein [Emcibacteraceae bacterium]